MESRNLEFYKAVEGSKMHYIITQGEMFYVFAEMDDEERGNFSIIHSSEVDETEGLIGKLYLRQFHPKELDKYDFNTGKDYRVHRIREICYILVAKRVLEIEKVRNEILFNCINVNYSRARSEKFNKSVSVNTNIFTKSIKQKTEKHKTISLKEYSGNCPMCKRKVPKNLIKVHVKWTCSKR